MTMPLSDDRLMEIAQSPRQALMEDVEDLCEEVYRLRKIEKKHNKPFDISDFELIKKYPSLAHPNWAKMLCAKIDRLREIEKAAINLIKVEGRHHSEIAYKSLEEIIKNG